MFARVADAMSEVVMALAMAIGYTVIPQPILRSHLVPFLTHRGYIAKQQENGGLFEPRALADRDCVRVSLDKLLVREVG